VLTDHPPVGTEGVRIAAARAGDPAASDRPEIGLPAPAPTSRPTPKAATRMGRARAPKADRVRAEDAPRVPGRPGSSVSAARANVLRQRRRRRRLLVAFTGFTACCTLVVGLGYVYVQNKLGQIRRLDIPALGDDAAGSVMNVLLVGSDARANLSASDAVRFGRNEVEGQRSDTLMLLHVDAKEQKAAIVSVPRDLYVPIVGSGYSDRVNAAFAAGGADQLVATVQAALGVTVHHYVQVDFVGFKDIVDTVGGVTMYVPYPVRDSSSGLDIGRAGCFELDGDTALSWVRSRNMEFLIGGTWQADGRGDFGRIERQQDFIRRMMKKALSFGVGNPLQLNRLIGVGVRDVTFDSALSTKDLNALGRRFSSLDPDRVVLRTLPTAPADIDGKSVLKLQAAQAQPMIDLLNGLAPLDDPVADVGTGPTTTIPPASSTTAPVSRVRTSDITVRVQNGVGLAGAAAKAATSLTGSGYVVAEKGDAPAAVARTTISYATGQVAKAQLLQAAILTPAVLREDPTLRAVDINLLLGADFAGFRPTVSAGTAVTTTAPSTTLAPQITPVPLPKGTIVPPC